MDRTGSGVTVTSGGRLPELGLVRSIVWECRLTSTSPHIVYRLGVAMRVGLRIGTQQATVTA